jgi:hypothetical protein
MEPAVCNLRWAWILVVCLFPWHQASATGWRKENNDILFINQKLHGVVIDHTANHGRDNRIWSQALCLDSIPICDIRC